MLFIPKAFQQNDQNTIKAFVATHPLATVIAHNEDGVEACHIPMYWQDTDLNNAAQDNPINRQKGYLIGHIAKKNPLNDESFYNKPWLIIFYDAGHYISPNWYPSKAVTHKEVPTWNYQSVHIKGRVQVLSEPQQLIEILTQQTARFESAQQKPWSLKDAPDNYIQAMCRAIVGIKIDITDIKAQFKLSQNKSAENKAGVVAGLTQLGTAQAEAMAQKITMVNSTDSIVGSI